MKSKNIYVDISSLIDDRFATIYKMDSNVAIAALTSGYGGMGYFHRRTNNHKSINADVFNEEYVARDTETLLAGCKTGVVDFLTELLMTTLVSDNEDSDKTKMRVFINMYPYKLDPIAESKLMSSLLSSMNLVGEIVFETCYLVPESITVDFIKSRNIVCLISYTAEEILQTLLVSKKLETTPIPNVTLLAPKIASAPGVDVDTAFGAHWKDLNAFDQVELTVASLIDFKYITASVFNGVIYQLQR